MSTRIECKSCQRERKDSKSARKFKFPLFSFFSFSVALYKKRKRKDMKSRRQILLLGFILNCFLVCVSVAYYFSLSL